MPESEDPRILSRERFLWLSGCLPCGDVSSHDLAQRERMAALEAERDQAQESARDSQRLLNDVNHELATLEADNRRLREALTGLVPRFLEHRTDRSPYETCVDWCPACRVEAALQPAAPQHAPTESDGRDGMPLRSSCDAGVISISIGAKTLAFAFENSAENNPYSDDSRDFVRQFSVSDPAQFAKDVCAEMNREGEDGSTPLTRFIDATMSEAVDQGSLGIHDPDDEEPTAPPTVKDSLTVQPAAPQLSGEAGEPKK